VSNGKSRIAGVNNDRINDLKHHFLAAAATTPDGEGYVGWYDDRKDQIP
jgi:hypothetical protein